MYYNQMFNRLLKLIEMDGEVQVQYRWFTLTDQMGVVTYCLN